MQTYLSAISSSTQTKRRKKYNIKWPTAVHISQTLKYLFPTYTHSNSAWKIQLNIYRTKLQQIECKRPTFVTDDQQFGLYIHVLLMCNKSQSTHKHKSRGRPKAKQKKNRPSPIIFPKQLREFQTSLQLVYLRYTDLAFQGTFHSWASMMLKRVMDWLLLIRRWLMIFVMWTNLMCISFGYLILTVCVLCIEIVRLRQKSRARN